MSQTSKIKEIIIPKEVQDIFDEADERGDNSAVITATGVKLVDRNGKTLREVVWPEVTQWSFQFLNNALQTVKESEQKTS